jgi:hypothetical protein
MAQVGLDKGNKRGRDALDKGVAKGKGAVMHAMPQQQVRVVLTPTPSVAPFRLSLRRAQSLTHAPPPHHHYPNIDSLARWRGSVRAWTGPAASAWAWVWATTAWLATNVSATPAPVTRRALPYLSSSPHCCVDPSSLLLGKTIAAYRI